MYYDNFRISEGTTQPVTGGGLPNKVAFKYRIHDVTIGRFLSRDPLSMEYPFYSPYAFSGNRVIDAYELEGLEPIVKAGKLYGIQGYDWGYATEAFASEENGWKVMRDKDILQVYECQGCIDSYGNRTSLIWTKLSAFKASTSTRKEPGGIPIRTVPGGLRGGSRDLDKSIQELSSFISHEVDDIVSSELREFGQDKDDVLNINIDLGSDLYDKVRETLQDNLEKQYPDAQININSSTSDGESKRDEYSTRNNTSYGIEVLGTETVIQNEQQ